jgi:2-keto-4-pentenoate hydratase/2-oxohepta-3-ene-1,7-dioic acid hydratase in catechol pathway
MRIARYEFEGRVRYGLADPESGKVRELSGDPFEGVEATGVVRRLDEVRLLAPVVPGKIVAVGLNYKDHAREMGKEIPEEPLLFLKAPSALNDPGGEIIYTPQSQRVDYEAELAAVIGRKAKNVKARDAAAFILGYTCINDVTARDLQVKDAYTWAKGSTRSPRWAGRPTRPLQSHPPPVSEVRQDGTRGDGASVFGWWSSSPPS